MKKIIALCLFAQGMCFASLGKVQPVPRHENQLFFEGDFLYWQAKQEGNQYASTGTGFTVPGTNDPNTGLTPSPIDKAGKLYAPEPRFCPGYRAALGLNLRHGRWDLVSEYTYLYSKAHGSVESDDLNTGILPLFSYTPNNSILSTTMGATTSGALGFVSASKAWWDLHFNTLTLELGRMMQLTRFLSLRPHFGAEGTLQTQNLAVCYKVSSITTPETSLGNNKVLFKQHSWGVGPRMGLDSLWKCWRNLGFYTNAAVALLWGQFTGKARSYDTNYAPNMVNYNGVLIADQVTREHSITPVLELEAGIRFSWIVASKHRFSMLAGWEEQIWFFENQHSSVIPNTSLTLQGATAKVRWDF